ncbi:sensor histidine kinase [Anaerosacchariphilus polymeriproducens]|uniref:histidine kinase n=1 Tax=Anaerosacchariphilus polymeriproducens TaxID=1812858 RepID=A0A371AYH1_9FIRM|nr:HAMP domain-containing sensor histidine kinase [Anaerosacchariphilus polymeriproducens]RDU24611.1 sensor histidine kinase [Anaerosacchariphilus polymeriproducens]
MKLFVKIFLFSMIVLSAALSLSGYLLIMSSYKNAVVQETQRAMDQYQFIKFLIQSDIINQQDETDKNNLSDLISASLSNMENQNLTGLSNGINYVSVFSKGQKSIYSTFPSDLDFKISDYDVNQKIINKIEQIQGRAYVEVLGKITQSGQAVYLLTATDIQSVIDQKEGMVRNFGTIYFITIGIGIVLVIIFSTLLTRPLRKMSAAAGRIADGNYSERLRVLSNDEIGELSKMFNMMAETIEERIFELSNAAKQKEDFVSNFAHELKTPLTSVIGYADMIYQKPLSREDTKNAAAYILDEGLRLEALSIKLMDLIVLNRQDFVLEELPADELMQSIAGTLKPLLSNEKIKFKMEVVKAYIKVDYDLFKTLLLNLIDNAVKAGSTEISLIGEIMQKNYRVSISDNGCGISADEIERITEAFYMVDKSRARKQHGAGLGLSLASKVAEIHGTRLEFISTPGKGTVVSLSLPLEGGGVSV